MEVGSRIRVMGMSSMMAMADIHANRLMLFKRSESVSSMPCTWVKGFRDQVSGLSEGRTLSKIGTYLFIMCVCERCGEW